MKEKLCISTKPQKGCKEIISSAVQLRCGCGQKYIIYKNISINGCGSGLVTKLMF